MVLFLFVNTVTFHLDYRFFLRARVATLLSARVYARSIWLRSNA